MHLLYLKYLTFKFSLATSRFICWSISKTDLSPFSHSKACHLTIPPAAACNKSSCLLDLFVVPNFLFSANLFNCLFFLCTCIGIVSTATLSNYLATQNTQFNNSGTKQCCQSEPYSMPFIRHNSWSGRHPFSHNLSSVSAMGCHFSDSNNVNYSMWRCESIFIADLFSHYLPPRLTYF